MSYPFQGQALPVDRWSEFHRMTKGSLTSEHISRFWSLVSIAEPTSCWKWNGSLLDGYGSISILATRVKAHRMAIYLSGREIPSGMCACHSCDNRSCVNPNHLWIGTNQENTSDRDSKGRCNSRGQCGEKQYRAVLTREKVLSIFKDPRKHHIIAADYDIARATVSGIKAGNGWKHVTAPFIATKQQ